jgi:hypothetical protein
MEYLMTYGWAILVIAVSLGVLYQLGVFGQHNLNQVTSCVPVSGWSCQGALMNTSGTISLKARTLLNNITITATGCGNTTAVPSTTLLGSPVPLQPNTQNTITFTCTVPSNAIGTEFTGNLWVVYTQGGVANIKSKFALISIPVSTYAVFGTPSYALPTSVAKFDGSTGEITTPSSSVFPSGSAARTVTLWVYVGSTQSSAGLAWWGSTSCTAHTSGFLLWPNPSNGAILVWGGCDDYVTVTFPTVGAWTFLAFNYSAGDTHVTYYHNDTQSISSIGSVYSTTSPSQFTMGAGNGGYLDGELSNVQVYDTDLTQTQIDTLYNEGLGAPPIDPSHLVGYWPLDGNAIDYSGNGNTGTIAGGVTWDSSYVKP